MIKKLKEKAAPLLAFSNGMTERRLTVYATSGCYYLFMALVPMVMVVCCLLPYTPFNKDLVLSYVDRYFSASLGDVVRQIVGAIYSSTGATLTISILLTLYSASSSMKALMAGMDAAYGFEKKDGFVKYSLRALLYMVFLLVALVLALVVMVYGGKILALLAQKFQVPGVVKVLLSVLRYVILMIPLFAFFALLYTWMPSEKVRFRDQIPGAVFAAVVWVIFSAVFNLYVNVSGKYGAYGFIGTIMVVMLWMYYCLFFLLIGGYLNSYLTEKRAKKSLKS